MVSYSLVLLGCIAGVQSRTWGTLCLGGDGCCNFILQCGEGEGDCDDDMDCKGSLKCGKDNCRGSTFDKSDDCCEHTLCLGEDDCCDPFNKCGQGEGDCDDDSDCRGSLKCGVNNCMGDGFDKSDDCCERWVKGPWGRTQIPGCILWENRWVKGIRNQYGTICEPEGCVACDSAELLCHAPSPTAGYKVTVTNPFIPNWNGTVACDADAGYTGSDPGEVNACDKPGKTYRFKRGNCKLTNCRAPSIPDGYIVTVSNPKASSWQGTVACDTAKGYTGSPGSVAKCNKAGDEYTLSNTGNCTLTDCIAPPKGGPYDSSRLPPHWAGSKGEVSTSWGYVVTVANATFGSFAASYECDTDSGFRQFPGLEEWPYQPLSWSVESCEKPGTPYKLKFAKCITQCMCAHGKPGYYYGGCREPGRPECPCNRPGQVYCTDGYCINGTSLVDNDCVACPSGFTAIQENVSYVYPYQMDVLDSPASASTLVKCAEHCSRNPSCNTFRAHYSFGETGDVFEKCDLLQVDKNSGNYSRSELSSTRNISRSRSISALCDKNAEACELWNNHWWKRRESTLCKKNS